MKPYMTCPLEVRGHGIPSLAFDAPGIFPEPEADIITLDAMLTLMP
jgi:hypothetical protein